jgi:hypothetical protein
MVMATAVLGQQGIRAFRYGVLSSRASGVLKEYLDTGQVSEESQEVLEDAYALLLDILTAQKLFVKEKETVAPSEAALNAFKCALEVIIAHQEDFDVRDSEGLSRLFETLYRTLDYIISSSKEHPSKEQPSRDDIKKTRMFFKRLAELMLVQLSAPLEKRASILI